MEVMYLFQWIKKLWYRLFPKKDDWIRIDLTEYIKDKDINWGDEIIIPLSEITKNDTAIGHVTLPKLPKGIEYQYIKYKLK